MESKNVRIRHGAQGWCTGTTLRDGMGRARRVSDWQFLGVGIAVSLEKEMATHPSILAWRIPGTEEPGGLPSVGSHRVGHD